ncbi:hypothetical protein GCM10010358_45980 [Streptomyces minutiscleroticus]|uniref:Uncharacterized protein n=1 Tax=Streptomyces minutiscleroticus TaxID=68238 RepID=A0A918NQ01_9ACTN|nr:hypothetical protein GCM10010358_45980 [Streptomyces minutiscleroticus]
MSTPFRNFRLGVDTTAAAPWGRLRANGPARVAAYDAARSATVTYVEVRCRTRTLEFVGLAPTDASVPSIAMRRPG